MMSVVFTIFTSRLLGWWSIDEENREEQARLFHDEVSGYALFYLHLKVLKFAQIAYIITMCMHGFIQCGTLHLFVQVAIVSNISECFLTMQL